MIRNAMVTRYSPILHQKPRCLASMRMVRFGYIAVSSRSTKSITRSKSAYGSEIMRGMPIRIMSTSLTSLRSYLP
jgi:hypothetical protein